MIAKCKAIAHGKVALEYIFREAKLKNRLLFQELCSDTPRGIYEEMCLLSDYNSRCRNKFLRIEIGIAPADEAKMNAVKLRHLVSEFIQIMGLGSIKPLPLRTRIRTICTFISSPIESVWIELSMIRPL